MAGEVEESEEVAHPVRIDYTNWVGRRSKRNIVPVSIRFGVSRWHAIPQWLLLAHDLDRGDDREFALKDIHYWEPK